MPLIPANQRTHEENVANGRKGGIASGKAKRDKKMLKDCIDVLLETKVKATNGKKITGAEALAAEIFKQALHGDMKAWELLRDTAGQKPVDKVENTNKDIIIDLGDLDGNND